MEYLFSYGTLQKEEIQLKLFGRLLASEPDTLEGYKVSTIEIEDRAFLNQGEERFQKTVIPTGICADFVKGMVLELSEAELDLVEKYEPKSYLRMKVKLDSGKSAWVFLAS